MEVRKLFTYLYNVKEKQIINIMTTQDLNNALELYFEMEYPNDGVYINILGNV